MPLYNNLIKQEPNIQEQEKRQTRTYSRPAPRSGWRVSLRLKGLAQASPLRPGESSTYKYSDFCAFSLRQDPPRLSETLTRSKIELVAWATIHVEKPRRASINLA